MNDRIHFLDVLKGIGIIFVVWGHIPSASMVKDYIFIFHMPLFFLISGILYKENTELGALLKKRVNTLLIPFLFFYVLGFIWFTGLYYLDNSTFRHYEFSAFFDFFLGKELFKNGNLFVWFLWVLFLVNVLYWVVLYFVKNRITRWIVVTGLYIFDVFLIWKRIDIPYFIDSSLFALFFFHIGFEMKKIDFCMKKNKYDLLISIAFLCLFLLCLKFMAPSPSYCDVRSNSIYGSFIPFTFQCFSMIFCLFYLSKAISSFYPLNYLGTNSLVILATQTFVISFSLRFILKYSLTWMSCFYGIPNLLFAMLLELPIIYFLNKYFPYLVGKTKIVR